MALQIEEATRSGTIPLIGVYGKSGSGKTHSALLLARGLAGDRPIAVVDTENKRSGILVGLIPGNFKRINLLPPFTPDSYIEAIRELEKAQIAVGVVDSMTHEWSGEGGVLEMQEAELQRMAGDDWKKREACKMAAWIKPKLAHKAMVAKILRAEIPLVCCLRADEKTHMDRKEGEKTRVVTDDFTTPDFDKRFIFEMLCNLETVVVNGKPGCARITKWSHPDVLACLPKPGEQITVEHGAALARWCLGTASAPTAKPAGVRDDARAERIAELWKLLRPVRGSENNWNQAQQWLVDENCIEGDKLVKELTGDELSKVLSKAAQKLTPAK